MSKTEAILDSLNFSQFTFYLTGSRWLECHRTNSDYDFFATNSQEIQSFLKLLDFEELDFDKTSYGLDPGVLKVFRKENVDVQLVESAELRSQMQETMRDEGLAHLVNNLAVSSGDKKRGKAIIWRSAWKLVELGRNSR